MRPRALAALIVPFLLVVPTRAVGDAVIRTQAMLASTIAEFFVEKDRIRVKLEIGLADLPVFRNLVPDDIYQKLEYPPIPLAERLPQFFREDLVIVGDAGEPLPGRILGIEPRQRVRRDELSGEPLPAAEGDEEFVVFAQLEYALASQPKTLTFYGPGGGASVGFVVYHRGIPVNDFRYLMPAQTLELDWSDPWYTRFQTRNLRRTYFEPMSGFIYVEPYEVRKEIIARPRDLQHWVDLGLANRETIPVEMQGELKRRVAEFLRGRQPVLIDGEPVEPALARINFLERTLTTSRVIDPPVELDVYSAILGVIFVYPTEGLPERVTMEWDLWSDRIQRVPGASVDQAGPMPIFLEPDFQLLEWQNFLKNPELPTLLVLEAPPGAPARWMGRLRWVVLIAALGVSAWWIRAPRRRAAGVAAAWAAAAISFWIAGTAQQSNERNGAVMSGLLHNIYRAFDFRDEERIYDTLAKSVAGDLLTQTYLEARRGLELVNQGGARVKVKEIELVELETEPAASGGFSATATWIVGGSVGHWGHVHQRSNQYRAELDVAPVDGVWKLVGLEILEQERL
ncbi:MAG: hypothetical protein IH885_01640 [Myxococcales bacterium]|nr:hypothetical protein [Myxococcales bacterium]